jgi:hypothetical protein
VEVEVKKIETRISNSTEVPTAFVKSDLFAKSALKVAPKTSRKEPPGSLMARDSRPITGRGFQIVLSRSLAEEAFPFISALEVLVPIRKKMCRCADSQKLQTPK